MQFFTTLSYLKVWNLAISARSQNDLYHNNLRWHWVTALLQHWIKLHSCLTSGSSSWPQFQHGCHSECLLKQNPNENTKSLLKRRQNKYYIGRFSIFLVSEGLPLLLEYCKIFKLPITTKGGQQPTQIKDKNTQSAASQICGQVRDLTEYQILTLLILETLWVE